MLPSSSCLTVLLVTVQENNQKVRFGGPHPVLTNSPPTSTIQVVEEGNDSLAARVSPSVSSVRFEDRLHRSDEMAPVRGWVVVATPALPPLALVAGNALSGATATALNSAGQVIKSMEVPNLPGPPPAAGCGSTPPGG